MQNLKLRHFIFRVTVEKDGKPLQTTQFLHKERQEEGHVALLPLHSGAVAQRALTSHHIALPALPRSPALFSASPRTAFRGAERTTARHVRQRLGC